MKNSVIIFNLLFLFFCCENISADPKEFGTMEGKVVISPLCGTIQDGVNDTNPCGFTNAQMDDVYSKYKVAIKGEVDGKLVYNEFVLDRTGIFTFKVPVGTLQVEVIFPQRAPNLSLLFGNKDTSSKVVFVMKNQIIRTNLFVDTGIR